MIRINSHAVLFPLWLIAEVYFLLIMTMKHFADPGIYTWHLAMQIPWMWFQALPFLMIFGVFFDGWAEKQPEPTPETNKFRRY